MKTFRRISRNAWPAFLALAVNAAEPYINSSDCDDYTERSAMPQQSTEQTPQKTSDDGGESFRISNRRSRSKSRYDENDFNTYYKRLSPYIFCVHRTAHMAGMPAELIAAISARESSCDEDAQNGLDRGLMGVRRTGAFHFVRKVFHDDDPYFANIRNNPTYAELLKNLAPFYEDKKRSESWRYMNDAQANMLTGSFYLRFLFDQTGDIETALRCYRIGETTGKRLAKLGERIPNVERYVRDVKELANGFVQMLGATG